MATDQLTTMAIRAFEESDWPQLWPIIEEIVRAGDAFPYDPAMTETQGRQAWLESPPGLTVVAVRDGQVLGTAKMGPNRSGPGAHISTASFMVHVYQQLGFQVLGTVPRSFRHPTLGEVGLHLMYREFLGER